MRIPPLYRRPSWQRFLAGAAIGGAISWCIFIYIYGFWQEKYTKLIREQQEDITELKDDIKIWQDEYKAANKRNIEQITVQKINVRISNWEKYKLDSYSAFEVEDSVKEDWLVVSTGIRAKSPHPAQAGSCGRLSEDL